MLGLRFSSQAGREQVRTVTLGYMVNTVEGLLMAENKVGSGERGSKRQGHSHIRVVCVCVCVFLYVCVCSYQLE